MHLIDKLTKIYNDSYIETRFEERNGTTITLKNEKIDTFESYISSGYAIRIVKNDITYNAFVSSSLDISSVSISELKFYKWMSKVKLKEIEPRSDKVIVKSRIPVENVDISDKFALLKELDSLVKEAGVTKRIISYNEFTVHKIIEDVNGLRIEMKIPYILIKLSAIAKQNGKINEIRRSWGVIGGWENVDVEDLRKEFEDGAKSAVEGVRARNPKPGIYKVIVDGDLNHLLAHEALGHASEADLLRMRSILYGKKGKKIASPIVDVIDDGTFRINEVVGFGWIPYDDEGIPSGRTYIIKEGKMTSFLTNRETAETYNFRLTGNGRAQDWNHRVIVRMTNTLIIPNPNADAISNDELIEQLKNGLLLRYGHGGQTNTTSGTFTFGVQEVYEIKNGEIINRLGRTSISGNILQTLKNISAVGKEFDRPEISAGFCGKEDQLVPVGASGVWLIVDKMHVGG